MVQTHHIDHGREPGGLSWLAGAVALVVLLAAILVALLGAFEYPKFTACSAPAPGGGNPTAYQPLADCS